MGVARRLLPELPKGQVYPECGEQHSTSLGFPTEYTGRISAELRHPLPLLFDLPRSEQAANTLATVPSSS